MKFDGVAPELINGRLAMLGFFAAVCAELFSHVSVFEQFKQAAGPIFAVGALITLASVIPIVRGTDTLDDGLGEGKGGLRCAPHLLHLAQLA
jgi:Chlorophyll A-B binding protein